MESPSRWFQFRLATLFVVMTVVCCWLGLTWKDRQLAQVVRERAAVIQLLKSYKMTDGSPTVRMLHDPNGLPVLKPKPLPAELAQLGAEPVTTIRVPSAVFRATKPGPYTGLDGYLRITSLFPEASCSIEHLPTP